MRKTSLILLSAAARHGFPIDRIELDEVVASCNKKRFSFNDSRNRIKANQGHSTDVDLQFPSAIPPSVLYHGTAERNRDSIFEKGLLKGQRHHVHLTTEIDTARRVGIRYGKPIILVVDTVRMIADGHQFWISENNIWLAETVPPQFLSELVN